MWLEEAKKRAEEIKPDWYGKAEHPESIIICVDAPRAYALLERAEQLVSRLALVEPNQTIADKAAAFLRDLEGKEEPDAQNEKG